MDEGSNCHDGIIAKSHRSKDRGVNEVTLLPHSISNKTRTGIDEGTHTHDHEIEDTTFPASVILKNTYTEINMNYTAEDKDKNSRPIMAG